jgi:transcriptional regulator with XRE-family HTH domain
MGTAAMNALREARAMRGTFGLRARALRRAAGLSQRDLARAARIDRSYIQEIERGIANPTLVTLALLAQALDCEPADLLAST